MTMPMASAAAVPAPGAFLTVGLDVGGTKTACVVTDANDEVLLHEVVPTDPTRLPGQLSDLIRSAVDRFPHDGSAAVGAIGAPACGGDEAASVAAGRAVNVTGLEGRIPR